MRIYIETYGCALNKGDSAIMQSLLQERGHIFVNDPKESDVIILNTCAVRLETEERMKQRIKELRKLNKKFIVAGCLAGAEPGAVVSLAPEASLIGPQSVEDVIKAVESNTRVVSLEPLEPKQLPKVFEGKVFVVPIVDGCAGECSFCITKLARRRLRSYPLRAIVEAVKEAIRRGAIEVELTGQDTAAYGLDLGKTVRLHDVVNEVANIEGEFMIRIGMMTPEQAMNDIDGLIEVLKNPKVYKFVHLPVQSGSDKVLKLMNRKYTIDEYKSIVKEIRSKVPIVNITTDIIVGHPGEDEDDFNETISLMKELKFERIHIAMYSIRPNTVSSRMPQVPDYIKKKRVEIANKVYEDVALQVHSEYIGAYSNVITTELGRKGSVIGRTINYIPIVIRGENVELGRRYTVLINEASYYDLRGIAIL